MDSVETKERLLLLGTSTVSRVNRVSRSFAELEMKARVKIRGTGSREAIEISIRNRGIGI